MVVRQETKRFQSIPMEIDFQYCQKQRQRDCGVDERRRCLSGPITVMRRYRTAK